MPNNAFVLDTHAWIWLVEGSKDISGTVDILERASEESELFISAISIWEVGTLESKGRIRFKVPCIQWVLGALEAPGLSVAPIDPHIAVDSSRLPGDFHGDPADRLIVATARRLNAILVTRDNAIARYSDEGYVNVIRI